MGPLEVWFLWRVENRRARDDYHGNRARVTELGGERLPAPPTMASLFRETVPSH